MSERIEAMTEAMLEFIQQDEFLAMVLSVGDDELLYPLKTLDGLERDSDHDVYLTFTHDFRDPRAWVDEMVRLMLGQVEAASGLQAEKRDEVARGEKSLADDRVYALERWPAPPPEVTDARREPLARFQALCHYVDGIVPAGDHRIVWSLLPIALRDPPAHCDFIAALLREVLPVRHRLFVRDDRLAPLLVPQLAAHKRDDLLVLDLDLSPARMYDDLVHGVGDRSQTAQQRMLGLFQLAAVDFAHKRHDDAHAKYAAVYQYFADQPGMQALCLSGAGDIATARGDHKLALDRHRQALALVAPTGVLPLMLNPMLGAGRSALQLGDYAEAEAYLGNAAEIAGKGFNYTARCDALYDKGVAQRLGGKPDEAQVSWRQAVTLATTFEYHDGRRRSLEALLDQHERVGAQAEADAVRRALAQGTGGGAT